MSKVIIEKLNATEVLRRGVKHWPIWEREASRFEWSYDCDEECYIIEGDFTIETDEGPYQCKTGDFITFKEGLHCVWDIRRDVVKHYNFK